MGHRISRYMFFLFALLSASSFRSPSELGTEPNADPTLTITFVATSKTQYTATFSLAEAPTEKTIPVVFKAGTAKSTISVEFTGTATSAEKVIEIVDTATDGKLVKGTSYTIEATGYTCSKATFTPEDLHKLTISSKLTPDEEGKKDGAKDTIALTILNGLLPKDFKSGDTEKLKLTTVTKSNKEYILDHTADKALWLHDTGMILVSYVFNTCNIKAGTDVTATLEINDLLKWENQAFKYAEGAKSVASVAAALFAVLVLVF
ncbi:hypothetical protein BLNAU_8414 [Blattamonas nauphoetae]|uniref:Uncharacterized protein n=1 Tax=Blattamonas nauphoetae TaxID=2049346 RepID=A0ABQ9XYP4_9EUKA|nr:hypothetical protein BLNAU_8414 [Blattamonas nauphoetae]